MAAVDEDFDDAAIHEDAQLEWLLRRNEDGGSSGGRDWASGNNDERVLSSVTTLSFCCGGMKRLLTWRFLKSAMRVTSSAFAERRTFSSTIGAFLGSTPCRLNRSCHARRALRENKRQRRFIIQPRVARHELPWVCRTTETTLKGLKRIGFVAKGIQPFQG